MKQTIEAPILKERQIFIPTSHFTSQEMVRKLQSTYVGLQAQRSDYDGQEVLVFNTEGLDAGTSTDLYLDLYFFIQNPEIPLENLCATFARYTPHNESQAFALSMAQKLVSLDESVSGAGLVISGSVGVGKTHLAVSTAKALMMTSRKPLYFNADNARKFQQLDMDKTPSSTWVMDDLNSPYGFGMERLEKLITYVHEQGGRILMTTNQDFQQLMHVRYGPNGIARDIGPRISDRAKNMFAVVNVTGESQRTRNFWASEE